MIVNDICLIYVSYVQQLQLSHLVFIYEKQVVFVPKNGKIVVKINGVASSCKTDAPTAKSKKVTESHRKKYQIWRKVLTKFIVSNVIDGIKIKLIERCQVKWISDYIHQGDPTNFVDEAKIIYWKRAISENKQLVLLIKVQQEKEKDPIRPRFHIFCWLRQSIEFSYICWLIYYKV